MDYNVVLYMLNEQPRRKLIVGRRSSKTEARRCMSALANPRGDWQLERRPDIHTFGELILTFEPNIQGGGEESLRQVSAHELVTILADLITEHAPSLEEDGEGRKSFLDIVEKLGWVSQFIPDVPVTNLYAERSR
jgi:hypothetical protein